VDECKPLLSGGQRSLLALSLILGEAVQFEPMKSVLKAPGPMLLRLRYDGPLSNFAFNFNLRRYTSRCCCSSPRPSTSSTR